MNLGTNVTKTKGFEHIFEIYVFLSFPSASVSVSVSLSVSASVSPIWFPLSGSGSGSGSESGSGSGWFAFLRDHDGQRSALLLSPAHQSHVLETPSSALSPAHGSTHQTEMQVTCFSPVLLFSVLRPSEVPVAALSHHS